MDAAGSHSNLNSGIFFKKKQIELSKRQTIYSRSHVILNSNLIENPFFANLIYYIKSIQKIVCIVIVIILLYIKREREQNSTKMQIFILKSSLS